MLYLEMMDQLESHRHSILTPSRVAIRLRLVVRGVFGGNGGSPRLAADAAHCAPTDNSQT